MSKLDRHTAPVSETANPKTDVLSESTDLDSLLVAILGEDRQDGDDRAQIVATIDAQVAGVVQELGLDKLLAERRRAAEAVARPAPAEAAPVTAALEVESDESRSAPSQPSRLRDTLARLFPLRTSIWLVVVLVGGAALVTVSAISERSRNQETRAAAPSTRGDVVLPASDPPEAVQMLSPSSVTTTDRRSASPNREVVAGRSAPRSLASPFRLISPRYESARPAPDVSDSKPPADSPLPSTAGPIEPTAARPVVDESRPAAETSAVKPPSIEQALDAHTTSLPVPAIIAGSPVSAFETSSAGASTWPAGTRRAARPLARNVPEYPAPLRAAKVTGTVGVTFTIDKAGRPTNVRAHSGPAPLRAVAETTIRQWRYAPATLNDVAIESDMTVQFTFAPSNTPRPE